MKRMNAFIALILLLPCISCQDADKKDLSEKSKKEIGQAEKDFETMAAEKGIAEAFWFYADTNAVIKRERDTLVHGKEHIKQYYSADYYKTATVKWAPDFIDATPAGDMGYTYGKYTWQFKDSAGNLNEYKGVFHTVWKKQENGEWKYVWD